MRKNPLPILAFLVATITGAVVYSAQLEMLPAGDVQFGAPLNSWILVDAVFLAAAILFAIYTYRWWRQGGPLPAWLMGRNSGET